jgi:hypothetical protein
MAAAVTAKSLATSQPSSRPEEFHSWALPDRQRAVAARSHHGGVDDEHDGLSLIGRNLEFVGENEIGEGEHLEFPCRVVDGGRRRGTR